MPFTPAHIAAVLPLRKRWNLVWSALIVGSVAPDFEYFLTMGPHTQKLHTFPGILLYTIPGAFVFLWVLQRFIKEPVLEFLPNGLQQRMDDAPFRFRPLSRIGIIVLSIGIGIGTHLAWDAFTHESTMITDRVAIEHANVPLPVVGPKQVYKVLQWGSSVVGLAIVTGYFLLWYARAKPSRSIKVSHSGTLKLVLWMCLTALALFVAYRSHYVGDEGETLSTKTIIVLFIVRAMAAFFWEVLAFSVLVQAYRQWMIKPRTDVSARSTL